MNTTASKIPAPAQPRSLEDTGLKFVMMHSILLKTMFKMNQETLSEISESLCLIPPLVLELIDDARQRGLIEASGSQNAVAHGEIRFTLSDTGKQRALEALAQSEYYGAMPIPLPAYVEQTKQQSISNIKVTRTELQNAMKQLILPTDLLNQLGPAVSAGRSVLMYGPPGNGKSSISAGIRDALGDKIYVPRALEYNGQIITVYDPLMHVKQELEEDSATSLRRVANLFDRRYVRCDRPSVVTGGELSLDMLDLKFNSISKTYQAPLQLKSSGGVFIVDDLGRQEEPPQKLINRWIVPLEEKKDILTLESGEKFEVPFDTLVIFSTNFHPNELFDKAALRRIFYKIKIDGPDQSDFLKIFAMVAEKKGVPLNERALTYLLKEKYSLIDHEYANYQPVFLIDQIKSICDFIGMPYQMSPDLIDQAWENMFVKESHFDH